MVKECQGLDGHNCVFLLLNIGENSSTFLKGPDSLVFTITSWNDGKILHVHNISLSILFLHIKALNILYRLNNEDPHFPPFVFLHLPYLHGWHCFSPDWLLKMRIVNILNVSGINVIHMKLTSFLWMLHRWLYKLPKRNPNYGSHR